MPVNNFSPWLSLLRGQAAEQGVSQAETEGMAMRDKQALRDAAAQMGMQKYFAGFEGVPGAERPAYLQDLYARGDVDAATKMEAQLAAPYATEREIAKAGAIELAKKTGDYRALKNAFPEFFNMGGDMMAGLPTAPVTGEAPTAPDVGEGGELPPGPALGGLSGAKRTVKLTPMGPQIESEVMSPFEKGRLIEEAKMKRVTTGLATTKERRETIQQADENIRNVGKEITDTQKAMQNRDMTMEEGRARIADLRKELTMHSQQRDRLLSAPGQLRTTAPAPAAQPAAVAPSGPPAPVAPAQAPAPVPQVSGGLTYKEQGLLDVKARETQIEQTKKAIEEAREHAKKIGGFRGHVKELHKLVTENDVGHPTAGLIPFGMGPAALAAMSSLNAKVKNLNETMTQVFMQPGQSRLMDTIVEAQRMTAQVPGVIDDPQLNKIKSAIFTSNVEHNMNFPSFLEKWEKTHNHSLDGATGMWLDYTKNNPIYTYTTDARGKVKVEESSNVMPITKWMKLRETGGVREVKNPDGTTTVFIKEADGSWVEK